MESGRTMNHAQGRVGTAARFALVSAAVILVTGLPYLYGFAAAGPDRVFTGLMYDVPDHAQYWSWVTASRESLFISNTMTPEANPPIFTNPMMWALAQVQRAFGLSFPALFQVWRFAAVFSLVAALWWFVSVMVPERARRRTAFWLSLAGSGLGWALIVGKVALRLPDAPYPVDIYTIEPNTFWGLLAYPYLPLAQSLLLASVVCVWRAHKRPSVPAFVLAGLASLALALVHAYDLIVLYAVIGAFGLALLARDRRLPLALAGAGLTVAACSAPMAWYFQSLTSSNPLWRSILAQYSGAGVWTPRHVHLIVLMGLPLILAVPGFFRRGPRTDERLLVSAWAAVGLVLIYLPVVFQIKMLGGWQFPIAALAAGAWHESVEPWISRKFPRRVGGVSAVTAARALLLLAVLPTNVYLYAWRFVELRRQAPPYYLHRDEAAALDWLRHHAAPEDVVLAPEAIGQFVPNYGESRAYLAHWAMTNRYHERVARVRAFFDPDVVDAWRAQLLRQEGVTLVLRAGSVPGLPRLYDPGGSPLWDALFQSPRAQIYRLRPAPPVEVADQGSPGGRGVR